MAFFSEMAFEVACFMLGNYTVMSAIGQTKGYTREKKKSMHDAMMQRIVSLMSWRDFIQSLQILNKASIGYVRMSNVSKSLADVLSEASPAASDKSDRQRGACVAFLSCELSTPGAWRNQSLKGSAKLNSPACTHGILCDKNVDDPHSLFTNVRSQGANGSRHPSMKKMARHVLGI